MARTKKKMNANMLWVLASLACDKGDIGSQSSSSSSSTTLNAPKQQQQRSTKSDERENVDYRDRSKAIQVPIRVLSHRRRRRLLRRRRQKPFKKRSLRVAVPIDLDIDTDDDDDDGNGCDYQVHTIDVADQKKKREAIISPTTLPILVSKAKHGTSASTAISVITQMGGTAGKTVTNTATVVSLYKPQLILQSSDNNDKDRTSNKENANSNANANEDVIIEDEFQDDDDPVQEQQQVPPALCGTSKTVGSHSRQERNLEQLHKPLLLPSYLPNPAVALHHVRSISLKIHEYY